MLFFMQPVFPSHKHISTKFEEAYQMEIDKTHYI